MSGARARTVALLLGAALLAAPAPRVHAAPSASDVRTAAERWCAQALARAWARPDTDTFVAGRVDSARGYWFAHVGQRWRGLAVEPVDVCVTLDARGTVLRSNGTLVPRPEPAGAWTLGAAAASVRARAVAGARASERGAAEAVVVVTNSGSRRAWRQRYVGATADDAGEVVVDGADGRVLVRLAAAWHAVGNVYPSDGRDPLSEVTLTGLDAGDSVLSGPLVRAEDGTLRQLVGPNGDFRLTPSVPDTTQFDEVNVWWYVQQYLSWLGSRGYRGFPDTLHVRTHAAIAPNVAYTSGNYVLLADSVANFAHDAAKARDVVTHELQHFVSEGYGLVHGSREGDALQEGLSDYMAAACTGDARIGEWEYRLYPNGVTTVASDPAVFNYANLGAVSWGGVEAGSTWADGMIFSGALWDLRTQLGATADSLVLETLPRIPSSPTFGEFAQGMIDADLELHGGLNADRVQHVLLRRGIAVASGMVIEGPQTLHEAEPGGFVLNAVSEVDVANAVWSVVRLVRGFPVGTPVVFGRGGSASHADTVDFRVTASAGVTAGSWGGSFVRSLDVHVPRTRFTIQGPPFLMTAVEGTFTVVPVPTMTSPPNWSVAWVCSGMPCGIASSSGPGWSFSHADSKNFAVIAAGRNLWGAALRETVLVEVNNSELALEGPSYFTSWQIGRSATFRLFVANLVPASFTWRRYPVPRGSSGGLVVGTAQGVTVVQDAPFELEVTVRDALGMSAVVSRFVQQVGMELRGPRIVPSGTPARFEAVLDSLYPDMLLRWEAERWCASRPCTGVWDSVGSGAVLNYAPPSDVVLRLTMSGTYGANLVDTLLLSNPPPVATIAQNDTVSVAGVLQFRANVTGASPFRCEWYSRAAEPPGALRPEGIGASIVIHEPTPFDLVLVATDVNARVGRDTLRVVSDSVYAVTRGARFGLECPSFASLTLPMHVWAPAGAAARLSVFDIEGREVASWFDGRSDGRLHFMAGDTRPLRQGAYFARWRAGGDATVRRFVVLR